MSTEVTDDNIDTARRESLDAGRRDSLSSSRRGSVGSRRDSMSTVGSKSKAPSRGLSYLREEALSKDQTLPSEQINSAEETSQSPESESDDYENTQYGTLDAPQSLAHDHSHDHGDEFRDNDEVNCIHDDEVHERQELQNSTLTQNTYFTTATTSPNDPPDSSDDSSDTSLDQQEQAPLVENQESDADSNASSLDELQNVLQNAPTQSFRDLTRRVSFTGLFETEELEEKKEPVSSNETGQIRPVLRNGTSCNSLSSTKLYHSCNEGPVRNDDKFPSQTSLLSRLLPELNSATMTSDTKLGKLLQYIDPYIVVLIFLNSVLIGISTFDFVTDSPRVSDAFEVTDLIFLAIFTVEVSLNLAHYIRLDRIYFKSNVLIGNDTILGGRMTVPEWWPKFEPMAEEEKRRREKDFSWLVFDLLIIIMSWSFLKSPMNIFRAFRILRAIRLLSKVRSLKNLTKALLHVCPKMGALAFITLILFTVVGVMITLLFQGMPIGADPDNLADGELSDDYFGTIFLSLLTLFQMMTFDNWHEPAREVMAVKPYAWVIFVFWVFVSGFVIMNLIIAIVCESLVKLDQYGIKAMKGQEIGEEFSIHDLSQDLSTHSTDGLIAQRLVQIESALLQLMDNEVEILTEIEKLKQS
ncbi:hypothetical protein CTEN210_17392 [Chaetoceros tenuissimus]|uniref:Ion transport domain-containing protein n=1 Tax=Chaetoceros tenuissimus TaxID=426638 RepID=A0AAD3HF15_9STRA|nr:hypothetical protein CTEN210_17392 [Chaetoceros tenuissimus]